MMMQEEKIIRTKGLDKSYHDPVEFQALKDINVSIGRGEFVSIVGASGSGKSTLLYV
ncbi:MAG: ATP-binding cassette domain-containing protein, partial [Bacteroidota bacterium]